MVRLQSFYIFSFFFTFMYSDSPHLGAVFISIVATCLYGQEQFITKALAFVSALDYLEQLTHFCQSWSHFLNRDLRLFELSLATSRTP